MQTPADYTQMVTDLAKDGQLIINDMTPETAHMLHMAVGVIGEVSEIVKALYLNDADNLLEECGDTEFYLEGLVKVYGMGTTDEMVRWVHDVVKVPHFQPCSQMMTIVAGELLDPCKKASMYKKDVDISNVRAACCAIRECLDSIYLARGWTRQTALDHNMNKLLKGDKARYKDGKFSNEAAQLRADKQGLITVNVNGVDCEINGTENVDSIPVDYDKLMEITNLKERNQLHTVTWVNVEGVNGQLTPNGTSVIATRNNSIKINAMVTGNA